MAAGQIYVARESAAGVRFGDDVITVHAGVTRVREGHALLKEHPDLFEPLTVQYEVEDTRNAPPAPTSGQESPAPRKRTARKRAAKKTAAADKPAEDDKPTADDKSADDEGKD